MYDHIQVNKYVVYRGKVYEVIQTNRLNNTAKIKLDEGNISRDISFDELGEPELDDYPW